MPTTLSVDLRQRVASAVAGGATCREAAERYGVSRASASRWSQQKQRVGHVAPKPLGGDQRSHRIEAHAELILQTEADVDVTVTRTAEGFPRLQNTWDLTDLLGRPLGRITEEPGGRFFIDPSQRGRESNLRSHP